MAKERPLDKDKSIGINAPVEELEVKSSSRYYPLDYSSTIAIHNQGNQALAEIPKSFAGIVEAFDEYRNNQYTEEEQRKLFKEDLTVKFDLQDREEELKTAVTNDVYDEYKRMESDVADVLNQANNEDASDRLARVGELLATKYRDTERFGNDSYGKHLWDNIYNRFSTEALKGAKEADYKYIDFRSGANILDTFNIANNEVAKGGDIISSFNNFVSNMGMFVNNRNAAALTVDMANYWNGMVNTRKNYILSAFKAGEITQEEATTALKDLANMSPEYKYNYVDKNGKPVLDSQGNPRVGVVTTTASTRDGLLSASNSLSSNSSGTGNGNIVDYVSDFKTTIDYDQIDKTGFSDKLFSFDNDQLKNLIYTSVEDVLKSDASPNKKIDNVREILEAGATAAAVKDATVILRASGGQYSSSFSNALAELDKALNTKNVDWTKYKLEFNAANGEKVVISGPPELQSLSRMNNPNLSAKIYWQKTKHIYNQMAEKAMDGNPGNILVKSDASYNADQIDITKNLNVSSLVADGNKCNDVGIVSLQKAINTADDDAAKAGFVRSALPDQTIDAFLTFYNNTGSAKNKFISANSIARALIGTGHASDIFRYGENNTGLGDGPREALNAIKSAIYISNTDDKDFTFSNLVSLFEGELSTPEGKERLKTAYKENYDKDINRILDNAKIPASHKGALAYLGKTLYLEGLSSGDMNKVGDRLKNVIKSNFVELDKNTKVKSTVFINSPVWGSMNPKTNRAEIENTISTYIDTAKLAFDLSGQSHRGNNLSIVPDERLGNFRLAENIQGRDRTFTFKQLGMTVDTPSCLLSFHKNSDSKIAGKVEGFHTIATLFSQDPKFATEAMKASNKGSKIPTTTTFNPVTHRQEIKYNSLKDYYKADDLILEMGKYNILLNDPVKKQELIEAGTTINRNGQIRNIGSPVHSMPNSYFMKLMRSATDLDPDTAKQLELMRNKVSYAGKVDQSNVSVPLTLAAVGNSDYIDMCATSEENGFTIDGTELASVLPPEGGITGAAAGIDMDALSKMDIEDKVRATAKKYGVDPDLAVAVARQESGFKQNVKSKAGAIGVMQLMPATAKGLGVDPNDVDQNIDGGVRYLADKYKEWGSYELALASYNAGSGNVKKFRGVPPFKETQNYVKNIMSRVPHLKGTQATYPVTYSFNSNTRFIDPDTNMLSAKALNDAVYIWQKGKGFGSDVVSIGTNRPELLENKPEYIDYKKYRDMKNSEGKPLFVKSAFNGFKVNVKNKQNKNGTLDPAANETIAQDMVKSQFGKLPQTNRQQAEALLNTFGNNLKDSPSALQNFGLANLTISEYNSYGVPTEAIKNPIMQARVLNQEFQRAVDLLGSDRKAVYALSGGYMVDSNGNVKKWKDIKRDKEAFTKDWYIKPKGTSSEIAMYNNTLARYEAEYHRLRGV